MKLLLPSKPKIERKAVMVRFLPAEFAVLEKLCRENKSNPPNVIRALVVATAK